MPSHVIQKEKKPKDYGFVRLAAARPELTLGNPMKNAEAMVDVMRRVRESNAQVICFPELGLTGYSCKDMFLQPALLDQAEEALRYFLDATKNHRRIAIVGMPLRVDEQLFNVAVICNLGKPLAIIPKTFIPTEKEFEEYRWYKSGTNLISRSVDLCGFKDVPIGTDIVVKTNIKNLTVGVEICEDFWTREPPSGKAAAQGATVICNLSASNDLVGKADYRRDLVKQQSARIVAAYVYCSCGFGESTSDVVFGGHLMIADYGNLVAESLKRLDREALIVTDVDVDRLKRDRMVTSSFGQSVGMEKERYRQVFTDVNELNLETHELKAYVDPHPFVPSNPAKRDERCEEVFDIQTAGVVKRLLTLEKRTGKREVSIGISGGLDSTQAFLVTVRAFKCLGWNLKGILTFSMPGFGTSDRTKENAFNLCKLFGTTFEEIDIKKLTRQYLKDIGHHPACGECLTCENAQARARTFILMGKGFVIGTGDLSELILGWCTYNGDQQSMYGVNCGVPKTLIKHVVNWVAEKNFFDNDISAVLKDIVNTPISPELIKQKKSSEKMVQRTEDIIGPYELHDFFIYQMMRIGSGPAKIAFLAEIAFQSKYDRTTILKWLAVFYERFFGNQFKRDNLANGPKVGSVAVSPRGDLRMPSDLEGEIWIEEVKKLKESLSLDI